MKLTLWANGDITGSNGRGKCPKKDIQELTNMAKKERSYTITNQDYRYILSAATNLVKHKRFKLIFLTFTFPFNVDENVSNRIITHFFKQIKRKYGGFEYIWTKERQKQNNDRLHYHAICDLPYIPIKVLQECYNFSISSYCPNANVTNNSLRLPPKGTVVNRFDSLAIIRYMAKYITKERGNEYKQPVFAVSKGIRDVKREITTRNAIDLIKECGVKKWFGNENFGVTMLKNNDNFATIFDSLP